MSKEERLDLLMELNLKLDKIIKLLEVKNNSEVLITLDNKEVS